jgi:allophanate hydrolase
LTARLTLLRAAPLTSLQDRGRFGMLRHGISASGPMDRTGYAAAGAAVGGGQGGIEFTRAGIELALTTGHCLVGFAGGDFTVRHNGAELDWPGAVRLQSGDELAITPGDRGNYGYLRFDGDIAAPPVLGSIATNSRAGLGGRDGRLLRAGDVIEVRARGGAAAAPQAPEILEDGPIRVIWGLHADIFAPAIRQGLLSRPFVISSRMDRMGVRLEDVDGVFAGAGSLSLVSDAVVPGDIQILGDGTPIVLMRDHQPTGGYPRIATIVSADLDRFAQLRPGATVAFASITVDHAHALLRSRRT